MSERRTPPEGPGIRTRPVLWVLLAVVFLGAVGLFVGRRGSTEASGASPASAASSSRRWHPRRGKEPETPPVRGSARAPSTARGRVVAAEGGAPIAGATVTIFRNEEVVAEVVTDEGGAFEARVVAAQIDMEIAAAGFVTAYESMSLPREPLTVALARGAVLVGQVVRDDTGAPVAGARVEPGSIAGEIDESWVTRTDAEGRFRVEGLTPGEYKPTASARGLFAQATSRVTLVAGEVGAPVTLRVRSAATVRARLEMAGTHEPCADGSVKLTSRVQGEREAATGAPGEVLFDAVPPGVWEVRLSCEDHVDDEKAPPLTVQSADVEVVFALHEKLAIKGTVVTPAGELVPGAWVEVSRVGGGGRGDKDGGDEEDGSGAGAQSDDDGRFTVRDLPAGTYDLAGSSAIDAPKVRVVVAEGAPAPEGRVVCDTRSFRGRVVDPGGEPIASAGVTASRDPSGNGSYSTDTDREGRFTIEHFGPGIVTLKVQVGGAEARLQGGESAAVITLPVEDEITLVAQVPVGTIEGIVRGGGGPRSGVEVTAECPGKQVSSGETDGAGRFVLRHVAPGGDCTVQAVAANGESAVAEGVHVGSRVELALRAAAKVRGTIAGEEAPFLLYVEGDGFFREEVFSGTAGAWDVPGVPAGEVVVRVETDTGHGSAKVTLAPGEERSIQLTLRPGTGDDDDEEPQ